ncbi:MAG: YncE family protein [Candidatus Zixiibacteriota bacterium]
MKYRILQILRIFLIVLASWVPTSRFVHADVDWAMIEQIKLNAQPLDIAASVDGKTIFILTPGKILVYSISEDKVTKRIPVDVGFDRIAYSEKNNTLILTSSSLKKLKVIQGDQVYKLDLSGSPFKGPADAAVTIAVFDDYQ